jgi:glutaredoxin-related protein
MKMLQTTNIFDDIKVLVSETIRKEWKNKAYMNTFPQQTEAKYTNYEELINV